MNSLQPKQRSGVPGQPGVPFRWETWADFIFSLLPPQMMKTVAYHLSKRNLKKKNKKSTRHVLFKNKNKSFSF